MISARRHLAGLRRGHREVGAQHDDHVGNALPLGRDPDVARRHLQRLGDVRPPREGLRGRVGTTTWVGPLSWAGALPPYTYVKPPSTRRSRAAAPSPGTMRPFCTSTRTLLFGPGVRTASGRYWVTIAADASRSTPNASSSPPVSIFFTGRAG